MGPVARAVYRPSFSPSSTMPSCADQPRSTTNSPMKSLLCFISSTEAGAVLIYVPFSLRLKVFVAPSASPAPRQQRARGKLGLELSHCAEKDWQETFGCQFTKAPFGFSFQAQTCSV